ncbi:MAG: hypothetical protein GF317_13805 [Candidatus Lokiarchaeota archaeon]|nr:hypothetical protein [Candidatus Lokiarchaeota archaeon]MBD3200702.1 hypothetical protein [Candidatus Lokiarchaeota archaeon]
MVEIIFIDGIPCIVLNEEEEKYDDRFREWKERNDKNFFQEIKNMDNLKDTLDKIKEDLEEK